MNEIAQPAATAVNRDGIKTIPASAIPANDPAAILIDVRTPLEFSEIHVPGSISVPLHVLNPAQMGELLAGKGNCYLFCHSGNRAKQAAEKLQAAGYDNIYVAEGGVQAWAGAGRPVNKGRAVISLERQVRIAAGFLVFTGAVLGYFVNPYWIALPALVGAGLMFAGITNTCGMAMMLARMPWNNRGV